MKQRRRKTVIYCRTHGSHCSRTVSFTAVFSQVCRIFHLEKLPHNVRKWDNIVMGAAELLEQAEDGGGSPSV